MACNYCRHYVSPDWSLRDKSLSIVENIRREQGLCTLSPDWKKVSGLHYCANLSLKDPSDVGAFWERMHLNADKARDERERRIAAEKKIKALRLKLKTINGK